MASWAPILIESINHKDIAGAACDYSWRSILSHIIIHCFHKLILMSSQSVRHQHSDSCTVSSNEQQHDECTPSHQRTHNSPLMAWSLFSSLVVPLIKNFHFTLKPIWKCLHPSFAFLWKSSCLVDCHNDAIPRIVKNWYVAIISNTA